MTLASGVARMGAPVTFSRVMTDAYDAATDEDQPYTVVVTGNAMRIAGDPLKYEALRLVQSEAPTLLFVPDTAGELPSLGASVTFGGALYVVRDIDPLAMNGTVTAARIIVVGGGVERLPADAYLADEASLVVASETDGTIA